MIGDPEDVRRALRLLQSMLEMSGYNRQDLDRMLGTGRGFSSQLFTERIQLKYGHILQILAVLKVEPAVFFRILFPDRNDPKSSTDLMQQFLVRLHGPKGKLAPLREDPPVQEPVPEAPLDTAALERLIESVVERAVAGAVARNAPAAGGASMGEGGRRRRAKGE